MRVASVTAKSLRPVLVAQIDSKSNLYTDEAGQYHHMGRDFEHKSVNHSANEYVRGEAHTNTVENYFSILKRGITGCYFHVSEALSLPFIPSIAETLEFCITTGYPFRHA